MTVPPCVKEVTVRLARADERRKWDALMFEHHYLRFIQFAGRGLRYVAEYAGQWLALLGWQSGAFKCGPRDRWIGWGKEQQFGRLNLIANNTRTLVLCEPGEVPNLASYVMAANLRRLSGDWEETVRASVGAGGGLRGPGQVPGHPVPGGELALRGTHARLLAQQRAIHRPARAAQGHVRLSLETRATAYKIIMPSVCYVGSHHSKRPESASS